MPVAPDDAWRFLQDIDEVAACIPGLVPGSVVAVDSDTFRGAMHHLALGIPSVWQLEAHVRRSEPDRSLYIHLYGKEERLDLTLIGDADLSIGSGVGREALLAYRGELTVSGRLAGAGGPVIERVVKTVLERFVGRVGSGGVPPKDSSLWQRLRAWLRARVGWLDA